MKNENSFDDFKIYERAFTEDLTLQEQLKKIIKAPQYNPDFSFFAKTELVHHILLGGLPLFCLFILLNHHSGEFAVYIKTNGFINYYKCILFLLTSLFFYHFVTLVSKIPYSLFLLLTVETFPNVKEVNKMHETISNLGEINSTQKLFKMFNAIHEFRENVCVENFKKTITDPKFSDPIGELLQSFQRFEDEPLNKTELSNLNKALDLKLLSEEEKINLFSEFMEKNGSWNINCRSAIVIQQAAEKAFEKKTTERKEIAKKILDSIAEH